MSQTASDNKYYLNVDQIRDYLPHRQPFLLIDRVLEIHPTGDLMDTSSQGKTGTKVVARKCISYNEPHFNGHFPSYAIMPGVLLIETMAQAASFSLYPYLTANPDAPKNVQCLLVGVDSARFRKPVVPGDVVTIETVVSKTRGPLWQFECVATVDGQKVCDATILANWLSGGKFAQKE